MKMARFYPNTSLHECCTHRLLQGFYIAQLLPHTPNFWPNSPLEDTASPKVGFQLLVMIQKAGGQNLLHSCSLQRVRHNHKKLPSSGQDSLPCPESKCSSLGPASQSRQEPSTLRRKPERSSLREGLRSVSCSRAGSPACRRRSFAHIRLMKQRRDPYGKGFRVRVLRRPGSKLKLGMRKQLRQTGLCRETFQVLLCASFVVLRGLSFAHPSWA